MVEGNQRDDTLSESPRSHVVVRLINIFRVVMYFTVAYVQFTHLECLQPEATVACNVMLVYVPLFLGLVDSVMVIWSANVTKKFWQVALVVSVLAILVSANSVVPLLPIRDWHTSLDYAMLVLGGGVFLVSLLEIIFFRGVHLPRTFSFETSQPDSEIRTY